MMSPLSIAQLVIYATLTPPTLYTTYRHALPGLLGWGYLLAFLSLRIIGAGLILSNPASTSASTISNIGLSPLLLATNGILHEAWHYRTKNSNKKLEWLAVLSYHLLVVTALALVASGASALSTSTSTPPPASKLTLLKTGVVILLLAWLVLVLAALYSLLIPRSSPSSFPSLGGTRLLHAVLASLPLSGIRLAYSAASIFSGNKHLSPSTGDLGYRVCLGFLPELSVVVIFMVVGLMTRGVRREGNGEVERVSAVEVEVGDGRK
ncbi:hypothetical protein B0J14DRAFT_600067 [Halenospora varia]|nr:hypothetical protein B0J14DRAFT_600067 [Halenospora varia]